MKKNELAIGFRAYLRASGTNLSKVYFSLFSMKTDDDLQKEIEYLYTLYKGTDSYFKSDSIDSWFAIWHKSIRQTDYFSQCFTRSKIDCRITDEERKEFKFLYHQTRQKGFSKTEGKKEHELFNDTYNRYLNLHTLIQTEYSEKSINGNLDSTLWNLIFVDKEAELMKIFIKVFIHHETFIAYHTEQSKDNLMDYPI